MVAICRIFKVGGSRTGRRLWTMGFGQVRLAVGFRLSANGPGWRKKRLLSKLSEIRLTNEWLLAECRKPRAEGR